MVIGSPASVKDFASALAPEVEAVGDVVIVGGSAVGALTARLLEEGGFRPRLIERDADRARELAEELPETTVMHHDGTDRDFLRREHVDRADVLAGAGTLAQPINALFESMSGFTTTGATVMGSISLETHSRAIMLWRQETQWLGGMGIVVLAVAISPELAVGGRSTHGRRNP